MCGWSSGPYADEIFVNQNAPGWLVHSPMSALHYENWCLVNVCTWMSAILKMPNARTHIIHYKKISSWYPWVFEWLRHYVCSHNATCPYVKFNMAVKTDLVYKDSIWNMTWVLWVIQDLICVPLILHLQIFMYCVNTRKQHFVKYE